MQVFFDGQENHSEWNAEKNERAVKSRLLAPQTFPYPWRINNSAVQTRFLLLAIETLVEWPLLFIKHSTITCIDIDFVALTEQFLISATVRSSIVNVNVVLCDDLLNLFHSIFYHLDAPFPINERIFTETCENGAMSRRECTSNGNHIDAFSCKFVVKRFCIQQKHVQFYHTNIILYEARYRNLQLCTKSELLVVGLG